MQNGEVSSAGGGAAEPGAPGPELSAREQAVALALAVTAWQRDMGRFPTAAEGLGGLLAPPAAAASAGWRGPYLDPPQLPRDPWGNPFVYRLRPGDPERPFTVYSCGPDGVSRSGGEDPDDIGPWAAPASAASAPPPTEAWGTTLRRHLAGPLGVIVVLLVLVAGLRSYAQRVAGARQPHPEGYVRRHRRRQRQAEVAVAGAAPTTSGKDSSSPR